MARHSVPDRALPNLRVARRSASRRSAASEFGLPVVLKADGLAAGKGVVIAEDRAAAERRDRRRDARATDSAPPAIVS